MPVRTIAQPPPLKSSQKVVLNESTLAEAHRIAERLHDALRNIFLKFQLEQRTASGLARYSKVERTVCQRLVSALMSETPSAHTLARIPGPKAITAIAEGLLAAGLSEAQMLQAAAVHLENFFQRAGRSQRGFTRALLEFRDHEPQSAEPQIRAESPGIDDPELRHRTHLFQIGKKLVKSWSRVQVQIAILAPSVVEPLRVDSARVRGMVGYHAGDGTASLIFNHTRFSSLSVSERADTFDVQGEQDKGPPRISPQTARLSPTSSPHPPLCTDGPAIFENFSSDPLPSVAIKSFSTNQQCFIVEPAESQQGKPFDVFLADQTLSSNDQPMHRNTYRCDEIWAMVNYPTEYLLLDVYLHTSIARMCLPGIDTHLWTPSVGDPMRNDRWATRLPGVPDLKVLSGGLRKTESTAYPRHSELVAETFARFGRDPQEFIGYRCEDAFPAWRIGYRMFFDYGVPSETP